MVDKNTVAVADKLGNVVILSLPADAEAEEAEPLGKARVVWG